MNLEIFDINGKVTGSMDADPKLFAQKQNEEAVYSALRWYLCSKRAGTHSTLTRTEVSGGGKKPWKQKGTGRARAGSTRSPLWRHGGVIFGPKPRDYSFALPKKIRKLALRVVLSDRAKEGRIKVIDCLELKSPKTSEMKKAAALISGKDKALYIANKVTKNVSLASRNLEDVKVVSMSNINIHDLMNCRIIVIAKDALSPLKELLA